jgi:hypothetical protein
MFLIAVDNFGRLLVESKPESKGGNQRSNFCLPNLADGVTEGEILTFLAKIGFGGEKAVRYHELNLFTDQSLKTNYASITISSSESLQSRYEFKAIDEIWHAGIDASVVVAMSKILEQVEQSAPGSVAKLEEKFLRDFGLSKKNNRVFFAKSETVVANEALISFLGAFAVVHGEKIARLCMHQDQDEVIQEMMMIHSEPITTGPLRQNRDSSVSYHMVRGALEVTLHHGGAVGDKVFVIEKNYQPIAGSSLRVPANIFRTIRTLTDSAIFVEVQSGPFTDSDTEWQL